VVVGAPDADGLDRPIAFVVLMAGRPASEDELVEFCREGIESYKRPRKVVFVDGFPTTATGKIRRVELRATARQLLREAVSPTEATGRRDA
jgi:benzoate-CoA ligase